MFSSLTLADSIAKTNLRFMFGICNFELFQFVLFFFL